MQMQFLWIGFALVAAIVGFFAGMLFWSWRCPFGDTARGREAADQRARAERAERRLKRIEAALEECERV